MIITRHAQDRWEKRFPGQSLEDAFFMANQRIGKKLRKIIKKDCPQHTRYCGKSFNGRYMRKTRDGIVFVIGPKDTVITVLDYTKTGL